ncbi:nuclear receptor corepressor 2 isoform X3 [Palaemon carinicauda]|uniref:nuclear receptor corepressor 2 isoform X3 n=1 Tax=Palaemon carinicauda TaxID=392227 RepID=UPI0035B68BAA
MDSVKLAGIGAHAPQILYPGGRQPPPGPQPAHPPPTSRHEGSPYKTPISPPMGSRAGAGGYAAYPAAGETHVSGGGGGRYMQQPPYLYPREHHYIRPASDRPVMLPHGPRRPTILGPYGPYAAHGRDMLPVVGGNPLAVSTTMDSSKRIKLSQPNKQDNARAPLVIDTSDNNHSSRESTYTPQVEAISPTLPSDPRDESPLRSTKDDLLKRIEQVDREIAKAESSIAKLRKKEGELEQAAQKGDGPTAVEEDTKEPKHQSIAQIIYAENRKKAEESHNILVKLIPPTEVKNVLPLYHQPTDTEVYMTNKRQYAGFKRRLMENFKRRQASKNERDNNLTQTYSKLMTEWLKKVEKVENSKKHKEKVAKNRELFEKVFPELRKQREEKERFSRVGARVKSDAEMDEILDGLQEQETALEMKAGTHGQRWKTMKRHQQEAVTYSIYTISSVERRTTDPLTSQNEDKKMRAYAVIPPILLEERKRKHRYTNRNGVIEDPITEYKDHKNINIWTEQEKEIFREKYLLNPKNFVVIGSYLERKSVSDCIQFYYSTKKKENYKMLVKRRIRRRQKPNNPPAVEVFGGPSTGVLTRGNLAAIKSQQPSATTRPGSASGIVDSNNLDPAATTPATSPGPTMGMDLATSVGPTTSESSTASNTCNQEVREKDKENLSASENNKAVEKPSRRERIRNKDDDKTKDAQDSSDEDNAAEHGKGGPHDCLVCGTQLEHFGQSRPVGPGQAAQYGLSESHLPPNPRVCTNCRCRHLRRRAQCPIPTCPSHKWRGKRLRPLPSRWADLPAEIKDPIIREFQIPPDVTKCCSACHNRIMRKLGPEAEEPVDPSRWSEEDVDALRSALKDVGCHWSRVAERLPNKTEGQCKSFYFNFKKKYKYDEIVAEYRKNRGKGDGPPTVTDEEESGSSTSSCDESGTVPPPPATQDSASDTTSAPSPGPAIHHNNIDEKREAENNDGGMKEPLPRHPPPPASVKEDYDSSATASADEGQSCVGRDSPPEVQHLPNPNERPPQPIPTTIGVKTPPPPVIRPSSKVTEKPNVRDIIFDTIEKTLEKTDEKPQNKGMPTTISNILRSTYVQRSAPVPPPPPPVGQEFHRNQMPRFNDPRDGLPHNDNAAFDPQDGQCEGLDLTVRKRDRSPPQPPAHQSLPVHHQPAQPPQQSHPPHRPTPSPREIPTVRGGAEVTITTKEPPQPPPRAHANTSYSKPPHEAWGFQDPRNKSPAFIPDSRALSHHQPPTLTNVGGPSSHTYAHVRPPPHTHPSKIKPSMAPPPPLTSVRSQHPPPQSVNTSISTPPRIPMKIDKQGSSTHVGSITHGTPVNPPGPIVSVPLSQAGRFDMMPKPGIGKEGGSITQGTPMHPDQKRSGVATSIYNKDGCPPFEARAGSGVEIIPRPALPPQYEREHIYRGPRPPISSAPSSAPYYSNYAHTRHAYAEPHISSRQIIAHDYQMSQQMINRRGVEKEPRVSPRARDHSPQQDPREHRSTVGTTVSRIIDNSTRTIDPRGLDIRPIELSRIESSRTIDPRMDHRGLDPRVVERINPTDPRYYATSGPHGSYQPSSQPPSAYSQERVSRPPSSPASGRDPTPSSPSSDPAQSPNDFRSPGVSTPTPPRAGVIQRHPTSKPPSHLAPPTSASPRNDDRYSPRHSRGGADTFSEFVNIAVAQTGYQRDGRPKVPHDTPQPEGLEKQLSDSMRVRLLPDDRRYYDPRKKPPELENDATQGFVSSYGRDRKPAPSPTGNSNSRNPGPNETLTAANLIDAIITHTINHTSGDSGGVPNDQRGPSRRHGETGSHMEMDKRVRSPATAPKEKEIVMVDDSPDTRSTNPLNHKEGLGSTLHSAPHHQGSQPKTMHAHMDQIIHREYALGDGRKMEAPPHMPYPRTLPSSSSSLEILRTDGRPYVSSGGPPAVTVSQVGSYELWKRGADKDGKDRIDSHSPHRPPPSAQSGGHHIPAQHLAPDERQIVRIKQPSPVSPRPDHKRRTPPAAQATSFPIESNSPPSSSAPPLSADPNHTDSNNQWSHYPKRPYQPKEVCQQKEVFDYVRNKIAEVMRTPEIQEGEKRSVDDNRHTQPGLQVSQLQHQQQLPPQHSVSQQNAQYDMEDPLKKRARLEANDRPPSRPRSTGGDMIKERREDAPTRDDVADSPQSGEMVIDESPRDSHPPTSKSGDMGGGKISSKGESSERSGYPPVSASSPYSYGYPGFRGHGGPGLGAPGVPPSTTSSTISSNSSGGRPLQGYEPHVEPVSDED